MSILSRLCCLEAPCIFTTAQVRLHSLGRADGGPEMPSEAQQDRSVASF